MGNESTSVVTIDNTDQQCFDLMSVKEIIVFVNKQLSALRFFECYIK